MIERMADFFNARADGYEEHMMQNVGSADIYYKETARCFPVMENMRLLDLGCGTGLELDELFSIMPDIEVTGVDMSEKMLDILSAKHPGRNMTLICADYFDAALAENSFDAAVAVQTMHHFRDGEKIRLYEKILSALKPGGLYVETDYIAADAEEEQAMLSEADRLLAESKETGALFHIDIPFTVDHQVRLMREAGFEHVRLVWKRDAAAIMTAMKKK